MRQLSIFICIVVTIKYIEAGVITSASEIWNNNINTAKHVEPNEILKELRLKKSIPTKYWISKNIPVFKKIPKVFVKSVNKLTKYPDTFYKELYGLSKIDEKVKNRMHLIKTNIDLEVNDAPSLPDLDFEQKIDKDIEMPNAEEVAEISLSQDEDVTTEDIPSDIEAMEDDQRLVKEFILSHTVIPIKPDCHSESSEEKKDLDEFIFMLDSQVQWEDVVDDAVEITTPAVDTKQRSKRSVHIIEEENMGTTVSGFKFTGRDTRLINDLHYRNINS